MQSGGVHVRQKLSAQSVQADPCMHRVPLTGPR